MKASYQIVCISFFGLLYLQQVTAIDVSKAKSLSILGAPKSNSLKQSLDPLTWIQPPTVSPKKIFKSKLLPKTGKIQRRDIPFQDTILGLSIKEENEKIPETENPSTNQQLSALINAPIVKPIVKFNETEAERAERIHKSFERLLTFVEIVGQVDNYVSSKWKNLVKTMSNFYEVEDEPYRVSAKHIYGTCPNSH